jgi:pimeloyl-ACP methyl ester carboxylesterase
VVSSDQWPWDGGATRRIVDREAIDASGPRRWNVWPSGTTTAAPSAADGQPTPDEQLQLERSPGEQATASETARRVLGPAVLAVGAGVMIVVGHDGSPAWQLLRVVVVAALAVAAFGALRRGDRSRRPGTVFTIGVVGVAVGVGIGLPHLAKNGLHLLTVAGLLSLAGGIVLLGWGAATLVRAARPWWRALVVPALLATVFVVVWTLGQAVAVTNSPRTAVGDSTPADVGLDYRDVAFETVDGVSLSGWYVPSSNGAAVVLLHGAGSTRASVLDHAGVLARHGYGVVLFDARGHGRSGGRAMDFGWYGDEDTSAAVSFLESQPDVDDGRIAAVGMSMGGEEAIGAAAADRRIRAVVAEGATNRVVADKSWLSEEYGWRGAIQEGIEWLTYSITDVLTDADPPIALHDAVAEAAPHPALLIAAGDVTSEGQAASYIASASPETVDVWVVPDSAHTGALDAHPDEWERRVTTFLDDALDVDIDVDGVAAAEPLE